jgi:hypothetical protein
MPLGACAARFKHNYCTTASYYKSILLLGLVKARFTPGLGAPGAASNFAFLGDSRRPHPPNTNRPRSCVVASGCCRATRLKRKTGPA